MRKYITGFLLCIVFTYFGQKSFEGKIEFMYYHRDTTKNVYDVKDHNVRLDQYSKKNDGSLEGSFLFNLNTKEIKMISHKRKLWNIHKSSVPPVIKGYCEVIKTSNTKTIAGHKCTEYVVKNKEEDIEISYWITTANFDFFIPLLQIWNRKDKQSVYFNKIQNLPKGSMPLLSIEKQISTGKILSKLETTKLSQEKINLSVFEIPKDYKKFEE
ncbi:MAG: hypothetical protein KatS3mg027_0939 [Bacteroidia bacterium]|nr:MAG: hypothetical protein KatS3mg027_0939 [Bacteroidia bacterium]